MRPDPHLRITPPCFSARILLNHRTGMISAGSREKRTHRGGRHATTRPEIARILCICGAALLALLLRPGGGGGGGDGETVPAAPGDDNSVIPPAPPDAADPGVADIRDQLLAAVNEARSASRLCGSASHGPSPPVAWSDALATAAYLHSSDMARHGFFSHTGSDGSSAGQRISRQGYSWSTCGENIAVGYRRFSAVVQGWLGSEGHCRNIMDPDFTEIGAGTPLGSMGAAPPPATGRSTWPTGDRRGRESSKKKTPRGGRGPGAAVGTFLYRGGKKPDLSISAAAFPVAIRAPPVAGTQTSSGRFRNARDPRSRP
jgi:hypothetical protein